MLAGCQETPTGSSVLISGCAFTRTGRDFAISNEASIEIEHSALTSLTNAGLSLSPTSRIGLSDVTLALFT
jgi:hypothetical protein